VFLIPTATRAHGYNPYALKPSPSTPHDHPLVTTTFKFEIEFPPNPNPSQESAASTNPTNGVTGQEGGAVIQFKVPIMHIHEPDPDSNPLPPVTLQITLPAPVTPRLDIVFVSVPVSRLPTVVTSIPQLLHSRSTVIALPPCGALVRSWRYLHRALDQLGFRHRQLVFVLKEIKSLNRVEGKSEVNPWSSKAKEDMVAKAEAHNREMYAIQPPSLMLPAVSRADATLTDSPATEIKSMEARWNLLDTVHVVPEEGGIGSRTTVTASDDASATEVIGSSLEPRGRGCVVLGHVDSSCLLLSWPNVNKRSPAGPEPSLLAFSTVTDFSDAINIPRLKLLLSNDPSASPQLSVGTGSTGLSSPGAVGYSSPSAPTPIKQAWIPPSLVIGEIDGMQTPRLNDLDQIFGAATLSATGPIAPYPEADRPLSGYSMNPSEVKDATRYKAFRIKRPRNPREYLAKENAILSAIIVFLDHWTNGTTKRSSFAEEKSTFEELIASSAHARLSFISILLELASAYASINAPETLGIFSNENSESVDESSTGLIDAVMNQAQRPDLTYHVQPPARWGGYFWLVEVLQRIQNGEFRFRIPPHPAGLLDSVQMLLPTAKLLPAEAILVPPSSVVLPDASSLLLNSVKNLSSRSCSSFTNASRICACTCYEHLNVPYQLARITNQPRQFLLAAIVSHQPHCVSRHALIKHQEYLSAHEPLGKSML